MYGLISYVKAIKYGYLRNCIFFSFAFTSLLLSLFPLLFFIFLFLFPFPFIAFTRIPLALLFDNFFFLRLLLHSSLTLALALFHSQTLTTKNVVSLVSLFSLLSFFSFSLFFALSTHSSHSPLFSSNESSNAIIYIYIIFFLCI